MLIIQNVVFGTILWPLSHPHHHPHQSQLIHHTTPEFHVHAPPPPPSLPWGSGFHLLLHSGPAATSPHLEARLPHRSPLASPPQPPRLPVTASPHLPRRCHLSIKSCPSPVTPLLYPDPIRWCSQSGRRRASDATSSSMASGAGARSGHGTSLVVGRRGRRFPSARALHGRLGDVRAWRLHGWRGEVSPWPLPWQAGRGKQPPWPVVGQRRATGVWQSELRARELPPWPAPSRPAARPRYSDKDTPRLSKNYPNLSRYDNSPK
jgi:hypothetical protein